MSIPSNTEIAAALDELGDLYQLDGAIVHRVVAYRSGAKAVRDASVSVGQLALDGRATELPGIGATLQEKIVALAQTGTIPAAEKLRAKYPPGLLAMTRLPGLGPKRARLIYDELGIDSLDGLRTAAIEERLRAVKGLGAKFETSIVEAIDAYGAEAQSGPIRERVLLDRALTVGGQLVELLRAHPASDRVELAGSARRRADTVKDLDVIATATDPVALTEAFAALDLVESASHTGERGARGRLHIGLDVDLKIVAPDQFGNLLQHFTGSKEHNMALRAKAVRRGLHISEYGILDDATGTTHRCATEEEVYALLGLPYIEPELRENRGELEPGFEPPTLVDLADIRGDLHCHTVASDGRGTIEEMAHAALERGYEYLVITDHSATHGFGDDVQPDELRRQIERVREVDAAIDGIAVRIGTETNILPDGSVDYDDDLLAELDWVVASVHTSFRMDRDAMTARMVTAAEHPLIDVIAHPTGRLIGRRAGYDVDLEALIAAAARTGTMLEINANPNRRDLDDVHARAAAAAGVPIVIDSDAHGPETLANMRYGVYTARRAWLGPEHIAHTRSWGDLQGLRKPR